MAGNREGGIGQDQPGIAELEANVTHLQGRVSELAALVAEGRSRAMSTDQPLADTPTYKLVGYAANAAAMLGGTWWIFGPAGAGANRTGPYVLFALAGFGCLCAVVLFRRYGEALRASMAEMSKCNLELAEAQRALRLAARVHPNAAELVELSRLDPEQISDSSLRKVRVAEIEASVDGDWFSQQLQLADALTKVKWGYPAVPYRERAVPIYRELLEAADAVEVRTKMATSLGGALCDAGRYEEAVELLRPLIDQPGADSNTTYNLAAALMNSGLEGRREAPQHFKAARDYPPAKDTHKAWFDAQGYG